jgi:hypothetical protein
MGLTQVFRSLFKVDSNEMVELMTDEMPWLEWLPADERRDCVNELLLNLATGATIGALESFSRAVSDWRRIAEARVDSGLAKRLSSQFASGGPVLERLVFN